MAVWPLAAATFKLGIVPIDIEVQGATNARTQVAIAAGEAAGRRLRGYGCGRRRRGVFHSRSERHTRKTHYRIENFSPRAVTHAPKCSVESDPAEHERRVIVHAERLKLTRGEPEALIFGHRRLWNNLESV